MLISDDTEYNAIWNKVYDKLNFKPSCEYRGHSLEGTLPFEIDSPYSIYAIENMNERQMDQMDDLIRKCLICCTSDDRKWYALDWHHSAFVFSPYNIQEQQDMWVDDERYSRGGYNAFFPSFYPDGDYYFFIDEKFENGYLGHPWRQEVWVFGSVLQNEIKKIYTEIGWKPIK